MTDIDLLLRGATVALCLFLILRYVFSRLPLGLRAAGVGFMASVIGYSGVAAHSGPLDVAFLEHLARINPVMFWAFTLTLFDERLSIWSVIAGALWLLVIPVLFDDPYSNILHQVTTVGFLAHAMVKALSGFSEDLVTDRRIIRLFIGGMVPLTGLVIVYFETFPSDPSWFPALHLLQSAAFFAMTLGSAVYITTFNDRLLPPAPAPVKPTMDDADIGLIRRAIAEGVHKTEGLTIGGFAAHVGVPEHRLRRAIHTQMGYRNFTEFLNDLRVDEAKSLLSDPDQARLQIAQIAYDAGYASLATFNRAFRARTGQSPTDFRRDRLAFPEGSG